jgi:predicted MFS family arabinose efflux permease
MFVSLHVDTPLWQAFIYMAVMGMGLGMAMQPLVLAVQSKLEMRDMGAGTSTATFARSLGGALGVAVLGALLNNRLAAELPSGGGGGSISINEPSKILAMPAPVRELIQEGFTAALHPVFLVAALVTLIAVVLALLLPNHELAGARPAPAADKPRTEDEEANEAELAAANAEASAVV